MHNSSEIRKLRNSIYREHALHRALKIRNCQSRTRPLMRIPSCISYSCPHGAFPINVHDLTAKLLSEVCHDVQTEPHLQPLTGEILRYKTAMHEDDARVDIRAAGWFWDCHHHCSFFYVRVFNAFAESNQSTSLAATFRRHEGEKCRAYEEHVREVERGSFTPLVFSSLGGIGKAATVMYRHLANLLSDNCKWNFPYSLIMGWL